MAEVEIPLIGLAKLTRAFYGYNSLQKHVIDVHCVFMLGVGRLAHNTTNMYFFVCHVLSVQ